MFNLEENNLPPGYRGDSISLLNKIVTLKSY